LLADVPGENLEGVTSGTYHDFRVEGETPLAALQKTQMEMLGNGLHEPGLWVGFSVYGCQ